MVLAATLLATGARAAPAPERILVASDDPELRAALEVSFVPRGVSVVRATTLHGPTDTASEARAGDLLVWLCDTSDGAALCVRRGVRAHVVRRVSMMRPLAPADAAALALSVDVAILDDGRPAVVAVSRPAVSPPSLALPLLSLEVIGGVRSSLLTDGLRYGFDVAAALPWWSRHVAIGSGLAAGGDQEVPHAPDMGAQQRQDQQRRGDLTVRAFARGQTMLGRFWLRLDAGPALHIVSASPPSAGKGGEPIAWGADAGVGAAFSLTHFFAGARVGATYLFSTPADAGGTSHWGGDATAFVGVRLW